MNKRSIAALICLCMVFSLMPSIAHTAGMRNTPLDCSAITANDTSKLSAEGWAWYYTAADGYSAKTLVLNGATIDTFAAIALADSTTGAKHVSISFAPPSPPLRSIPL